ncbi:MAG: hypothetical protein CR982_05145 [Candidatus Cloacimonadota bacterium]|nr:MAG: hypothetical protein CR982_05145 [Candidatus Cloacimonadota bacterium]PIE78805.1 MAG: hypothetical protein CSA15_06030 [Candidatus Delongbacteria bacterium]
MLEEYNFYHKFKIHFDECDMWGIVHNSNYLKYFERGRTEYISNLGFEYCLEDMGEDYYFVIRSNYCEYLKAAKFNQVLRVYVKSTEIKRSSWRVDYIITDNEAKDMYAKGYTVLVKTDSTYTKPRKITDWLRDIVENFESKRDY